MAPLRRGERAEWHGVAGRAECRVAWPQARKRATDGRGAGAGGSNARHAGRVAERMRMAEAEDFYARRQPGMGGAGSRGEMNVLPGGTTGWPAESTPHPSRFRTGDGVGSTVAAPRKPQAHDPRKFGAIFPRAIPR